MNKQAVLITAFLLMGINGNAKYHPDIHWREMSGIQLIVVFPAGADEEARFTLQEAKTTYNRLQRLWNIKIKKKIRILLTDSSDLPRNFATFFPFNQIVLSLAHPPPDSPYGNFRDWIPLALAHEMTLIFIFNAGPGYLHFLRGIFGNLSIFYPMARFPNWLLEGLAIYGESHIREGGRLNNSDYDILLREILRSQTTPNYLTLYGIPTRWPVEHARSLYGSKFLQYLARQYGPQTIPELVRHQASHPIILNVQRRFATIFGKRLKRLWKEFVASIDRPPPEEAKGFTTLTTDGMEKKYPVLVAPGKVIYMENNFREFPGVSIFDLDSGVGHKIFEKKAITGLHFSPTERAIYFSAPDYYKSYYEYSDLYRFDLKSNELSRLSAGRQLFYPVQDRRTQILYCVKRVRGKDHLAIYSPGRGKEQILSSGYPALAYPVVSPDGKLIAVSLKRKNKRWCVALFGNDGQFHRVISPENHKCYYPKWTSSQNILFIMETGGTYRLAGVDTPSDVTVIYNDRRLPPIKFFDISPNTNEVIVSFVDGNGYNLGRFNLSDFQTETNAPQPADPVAGNTHDSGPRRDSARRYNYWRDLMPKHMTVTFRNSGNEIQPGIYLSGTDLLQEHSFFFKGYHGLRSGDWNFGFNAVIDTLYPSILIDYHDYRDIYESEGKREYKHRITEFKLGCLLPLSLGRRSQSYLYANFHFQRTADSSLDSVQRSQKKYNGFKLAYLFNSSQKYRDSISRSDGIRLAVSYARDIQLLGSRYTVNTAAFEYKQFIPVFRPNVLALRLAARHSWGQGKREFHMGGDRSESGFMGLEITEQGLFGLMRGYPAGFFPGNGGYLVNLEFRMSIMKIERCFSISPSFEQIYLTFFSDIGNVWRHTPFIDPFVSIGIELNIDIFLGERLPFCAGVSYGNQAGSPTFYLRIGESF
jgi:hypothetical protein